MITSFLISLLMSSTFTTGFKFSNESTFFNEPVSNDPTFLNKAVQIRFKGKMGSGFYYVRNGGLYLVTAAHVLFEEDSVGRITNKLKTQSIDLISYNPIHPSENSSKLKVVLDNEDFIKSDPKKDVCVLRINRVNRHESLSDSLNEYPNVRLIKGNKKIDGFDSKYSVLFEDLSAGQDIVMIGYPDELNVTFLGTRVYESDYPLATPGTISGVNRNSGIVIVSGAAYKGNSGSAVLRKSQYSKFANGTLSNGFDYDLIGLVSAIIPLKGAVEIETGSKEKDSGTVKVNSSYSIVIPIKFVDNLIDE